MMVDELDLKILHELYRDGRAAFADIARKLGVSENTVRFRYKRMLEEGVIRRITVLVDHTKLGLNNSAALMLKIEPTEIQHVLEELKAMREVYNIYQLSGDYDAIAVVVGRDLDHIREIVENVKKIKGVSAVNTLITLRVVKTENRYDI
ncbi:MAG: Lrp/AsnC family transcriptional regulator [Candidatus Caldarchaeum sp.]